jgi:hypothetical protein
MVLNASVIFAFGSRLFTCSFGVLVLLGKVYVLPWRPCARWQGDVC